MSTHTVHRLLALLGLVVILALALTAGGVPLAAQQVPAQVPLPDSETEATNSVQSAQNVEFVGQIGGEINAVAVQGSYAYVAAGARLVILNIYNPASPTVVGRTPLLGGATQDVAVLGGYAYVADGMGLRIFSISAPSNPYEVGFYETPGWANGVVVSGSYAYVADYAGGLRVVNVFTPSNPYEVGFYDTPGNARDVVVAGGYAYVADGSSGLRVINVSSPSSPYEVGFYDTPGNAYSVAVAGSYAYVADGDKGLRVINVSNPSNPREMGSWVISWPYQHADDLVVSGNYVYIAYGGAGLRVVNVSSPSSPYEMGSCCSNVPGGFAVGVAVAGNYAYLAYEARGLLVVRISTPSSPYQMGSYESLGWTTGVTVVGPNAYIADGYNGLKVINIATPVNPVQSGFCDTTGYAWSTAIAGRYAYIADGSRGLQVVDISNPAYPTPINLYQYPDFDSRDVAVAGAYAYVADGGFGLRVVNVSTPSNRYTVSLYDTPGAAQGVALVGNLAYVADGSGGLRVMDITSPWQPREVGFYDTPGEAWDVVVMGYYAYVADGTSGLRIVDISIPTNPREVGVIDTPGGTRGVAVADGYAYVADNYSGLRVIDASIPGAPREVGFYDTPGDGWGVAVSGGYVYVADGRWGLHIVRFVTSSISGRVTDASGVGIPDVTVWAGATRSTTTDANGNYSFTGLPAGTYTIRPEKAPYAFSPASRTVTVPADQTGVDFRRVAITKIQVNQALGNTTNYVAGKDTVIQVMLSDRVPYYPANQQVVVKRNGVYITTLKPIKPAFPTQTLNFWGKMGDCGNWQQGYYTFEATVNGAMATVTDLMFRNRDSLTIRVVPVLTRAGAPTFDWGQMQRFIESVYPLKRDGITWRLWEPQGPLDARDLDLTYPYEGGKQTLEERLRVLLPPGCDVAPGNECPRILGIIHYDPAVGKGWTRTARVAVVADVPEMQTVIAHEIGHDIGFTDRPFTGLGDVYDDGMFQCLINPAPKSYVGRDGRSGPTGKSCTDSTAVAWIPSATAPNASGATVLGTGDNQDWPYEVGGRGILGNKLSFMGHEESQDNFWVTPDVYQYLFDQLAEPTAQAAASVSATGRVAVLSGWVSRAGSASFRPAYHVMASDPASTTGAYSVEVLDVQGQSLASQSFDVSFVSLSDPPQDTNDAPFRVAVRFPEDAQKLRLKHGATVLTETTVSAHAPTLSLTSPTPGQTWAATGNYTIRWQGSDLDGDTLHYTVLYRQDGGDWSVLAADLTASELTVDAAGLPGGTAAQVQVWATDGINTTTAESGLFTVGRKGPEAFITFPAEGASFMPGASFFLRGTAYDLEDGRLPDSAYRWTSNRDGDLGTGASNLVILSPGAHVITLRVTDSDGNAAVKTIRLSAGDRVFLPLIWRAQ